MFLRNSLFLFSISSPQRRLVQPINASSPISETQIGMLIHDRDEHPSNALFEIRVRLLLGMNIETRLKHDMNAPSLMICVVGGREKKEMVDAGGNKMRDVCCLLKSAPLKILNRSLSHEMLLIRKQFLKEPMPIPLVVSELSDGMVRLSSCWHSLNEYGPRLTRCVGIVMLVSDVRENEYAPNRSMLSGRTTMSRLVLL